MNSPAITSEIPFGEFFETGQDEVLSPFLTPDSRKWAINLSLKSSLFSAVLLACAYFFYFYSSTTALSYLFLLFVYFLAGIPSLIESIEDLYNLNVNIDVLMTLAAFGSVLIGSPLEGGLLLVLFSISGAMEETVTRRAKDSISSLHKLTPTRAGVIGEEGIIIERALSEITPQTKILVKAGQIIPLDGEILEGTSSVNLVHLTGENLPVTKKPGDIVPAGALNMEGALVISVTHTSTDSTLARIIQLVTEAQEAKPQLQRWFDRLSKSYATTIILAAFFFALSFPILLGIPFLGHEGSIYRALAFLIAASPCALIIAIPISYLSAIGSCAKKGIILKGGIILDALATCKKIAFDKTGTLTTGELVCLGFEPLFNETNTSTETALDIAFALEQNAVHPIASAITKYAISQNRKPYPIQDFKLIAGYGLEAFVENLPVAIGNPEFIVPQLNGNNRSLLERKIQTILAEGELIALMLMSKEVFIFRFQDTLRPRVKKTLDQLKRDGYDLMMLSGDHYESARSIAHKLGINDIRANLKPDDKLEIVSEEASKTGLIMVGDGINDAPALARSTVGISMGKVGSAAAVEAADVVLLQDNIDNLDWLMRKAKKTQAIVRENLFIATLAIFVASIPALGGIVPLWLAVLLHEGGTVLVGLNGLRLLKTK